MEVLPDDFTRADSLPGSCQQEQEKQQTDFTELDKVIDRPVLKTEFFMKA